MSRIGLVSGFSMIPEGTQVFKITSVSYDETFGKLEVKMVTADGKGHTERYTLLRDNNKPNEGAIKAFSYFAHTALQDYSLEDIDPEDLVGHYIECEVTHDIQPKRDDPTQTVTWVRLGNKKPANGFPGESAKTAPTSAPASAKKQFDLDDLLG